MSMTIRSTQTCRKYIDASELHIWGLYSRDLPTITYNDYTWVHEATDRDSEGEITLWTYFRIDDPAYKLIIFND